MINTTHGHVFEWFKFESSLGKSHLICAISQGHQVSVLGNLNRMRVLKCLLGSKNEIDSLLVFNMIISNWLFRNFYFCKMKKWKTWKRGNYQLFRSQHWTKRQREIFEVILWRHKKFLYQIRNVFDSWSLIGCVRLKFNLIGRGRH